MDAGVGVKAYAVIEQGKIGQILSARPTDRRQLIEEAAGITKYKSRRRSAELKLEAAQQNLTRVDDIIFEVEKQRGALKRQAAKARRYKRLREAAAPLGEGAVRAALSPASARRSRRRAPGSPTRARGRPRPPRTWPRSRRTLEAAAPRADRGGRADDGGARSGARARAVHRPAAAAGGVRQAAGGNARVAAARSRVAEIEALEARRDAGALELDAAPRGGRTGRRRARARRRRSWRRRKRRTRRESHHRGARVGRRSGAQRSLRGGQRRDRACATPWSTPPRPRGRGSASSSRSSTSSGTTWRSKRSAPPRSAPPRKMRSAGRATAMDDAARRSRRARIGAVGRAEPPRGARPDVRTREHELAGVVARLKSLEELDAARAEYGDGARIILAESGDAVSQLGSVADYVDVDQEYERAVDASLGDLLQHVVVRTHADAAAGPAVRPRACRRPRRLRDCRVGDGEQPTRSRIGRTRASHAARSPASSPDALWSA